jgi:nucleoprotein TPR
MAAEVDVRAISAFSSLPESSVNSLLSSPTADLVASLLKSIEAKVKEFEQNKSQKVRLEVELETVVRTSESKAKVLQNSRDKALAESSKLRVELQVSGTNNFMRSTVYTKR